MVGPGLVRFVRSRSKVHTGCEAQATSPSYRDQVDGSHETGSRWCDGSGLTRLVMAAQYAGAIIEVLTEPVTCSMMMWVRTQHRHGRSTYRAQGYLPAPKVLVAGTYLVK